MFNTVQTVYIWPEELRPMDQIFVQRTKWRQSTRRPRSVGEVILGEKWSEAWRIACLRMCDAGEHAGGQKNPEAEGTDSTTRQGDRRKFLIV